MSGVSPMVEQYCLRKDGFLKRIYVGEVEMLLKT